MDDEISNKEPVLIPIEERNVDFYGDEITMALVQLEQRTQLYIPLRPICTYLGLSWSGQRERTAREPVLSQEVRLVRFTPTKRGGNPEFLCLPLELLNGWLFGVIPSRVRPEIAAKLMHYRQTCFRVLWHAFQADRGSTHQLLPFWTDDNGYAGVNVFSSSLQQTAERVRSQCIRAKKANLPATLTLVQWLHTLDYFGECCAYCQEKPGVVIEHFIPLSFGGGTTVGNCVPSCYACNSKKGDNHPDMVTTIPREVINSVQTKLLTIKNTIS